MTGCKGSWVSPSITVRDTLGPGVRSLLHVKPGKTEGIKNIRTFRFGETRTSRKRSSVVTPPFFVWTGDDRTAVVKGS